MTDQILDYLKTIIHIPSPTGYTSNLADYLVNHAKEKNIEYQKTKKGAVFYHFKGKQSSNKTMFAVHMDTLGAMVKEVRQDDLKLTTLGGYPLIYIIGNYCTIHGFDQQKYTGTILPDDPAAHVNKKLKDINLTFENISVRVDLVTEKNKNLNDYFTVGNMVSFDPQYQEINNFIKCRHLDDKASGAILLYLADQIAKKDLIPQDDITFFFNVTEETGQGIAGFPDVDNLIVVDMGVVGNGCTGDEMSVSICSKDSSGPYNYELTQYLMQLAQSKQLKYKMDVFPFYGSDGSALLRSCHDLRVALIGPGVSASHGYERTHVSGLENTCKLVQAFIEQPC